MGRQGRVTKKKEVLEVRIERGMEDGRKIVFKEKADELILKTINVTSKVIEGEVLRVGVMVSTMEARIEARMASVETASHRSAEGVELLVRLVATSSLSAGASPETASLLQSFGQLHAPKTRLELPSPPAAPPPPLPRTPGYLQSILLQSAGN